MWSADAPELTRTYPELRPKGPAEDRMRVVANSERDVQDVLIALSKEHRRFSQTTKHHIAPKRVPRRRREDAVQVVSADGAGPCDFFNTEVLPQVRFDKGEGSIDRVHRHPI